MTEKHASTRGTLLALLLVALPNPAQSASMADWEGCSSIPADADRLACYDRVSGHSQPEPAPQPEAIPQAEAKATPPPVTEPAP